MIEPNGRHSPPRVKASGRYARLLRRYLRPELPRMAILATILVAVIAAQVVAPLLTSRFIDRATSGSSLRPLILLALLTTGVALLGQVLAVVETYVAENVSWAATNALRADLLAHLLRLDASFHNARTPGELIERVDGDVSTLARFFSRFVVYVIGNGLLILAVIGLLFAVDWRIGLGLGSIVLLALLVMVRIRSAGVPYWAAERQASASFYGFLGEYLAGLEDIRSSGAGAFVLRRCAQLMRPWLSAYLKAEMFGYALISTSQGLFAIGTAVAFALSATLYRSGALTIGTVYLIFQYTAVLRQPTDQIRNEVQDLQQADASIRRIEALLAIKPSIVDGDVPELPGGRLSVDLDHVTFGYDESAPVLHDISLRLEPGRVLGVVGRTGSGKTTLTRLLPRFHDPQSGVVRLGGVDVRSVRLEAVRARIGLVTQEIHLFDASLRDNLTLFDIAVSDHRIRQILDDLGLASWLTELPAGLDTLIGRGGVGLSAGQAQVLACARVFLRDPDVVILDEASSRLDPATERLVHTAMARLLEGRTGIIVAHRLSTIAFADDLLVLEDGKVREYGPRQALADDPDSRFAELLRMTVEVTS